MPNAGNVQRRGCRGAGRVLMFVIFATVIALFAVAIYGSLERPAANRLTPADVDYNPAHRPAPVPPP